MYWALFKELYIHLPHLILYHQKVFYYHHFIDEETEAEGFKGLAKPQYTGGKATVQTQEVWCQGLKSEPLSYSGWDLGLNIYATVQSRNP